MPLLDCEMEEINLSEVDFVELLRNSKTCCIFRVRYHGKDCVMKVFHYQDLTAVPDIDRDLDLFRCESRAYARLKGHGLCEKGHIPDFYGVIKDIDPQSWGWEQHFECFIEDLKRPNAILIEYIPNIRMIDLSNFSEERVQKLRDILTEIHNASVYHADHYPRNMMVQNDSNRVLWIDFDRAQTFNPDSITSEQQEWMEFEGLYIDEYVCEMAKDYKDGKIDRTWLCYHG